MMSARQLLVLMAVALPIASGTSESLRLNVNPIRRVVTMMQMMSKKVEAEGAKEQQLFDAFMCYCKNGVNGLVTSIKDGEAKIAQLESGIEETDASVKQLVSDVKKAKADRKESEETMGKAKGIRSKEAQAFAKSSAESKTNIAAMGKAVAALEKGMGGAFLQTNAASDLKKLSITMDLSEADRDVVAAFLSNGQGESEGDASSGEITGILKQMQETMQKDLAEEQASEAAAIKDFDALMAAKQKQVSTLTKEIESKMMRSGEAGVELTNQQEDLADTKKSYAEDKKFLIDVTQDCQTKEAEKAKNDALRADELLAIADTIKILNDDDALDLFKKTLPSPSLLQLRVTSKSQKALALQILHKGKKHHKDYRLNLISLALRGKKVSFDKVIGMISDMSELLKKEQASDDQKKAYCEKELDQTEDELKTLLADTKDLEKAISEHKANIEAITQEIDALTEGIKTMDKQVAEATENRKSENAEYKEIMASNGAAKELLGMAKNRLSKFYSPTQYKAPPARQMTEEERISVNMGGTLAPTAPPGGISNTGVTAAFAQYQAEAEEQQSIGFLQVRAAAKKAAPPPPPATAGAYKKSSGESGGIMAMIDLLVADLTKEMTESDVEEKNAQAEYEQLIKDSADKRAGDSKSISDKEGNKVELQGNTLKMQQERKDKMQESMAKMESMKSLHGECDWLVSNYATRKEARASEIENLTNAKAVLSGADYSFLQTGLVKRHF